MQRFLISVFRQPVVGDDVTPVTVPDTVSKECHMPAHPLPGAEPPPVVDDAATPVTMSDSVSKECH